MQDNIPAAARVAVLIPALDPQTSLTGYVDELIAKGFCHIVIVNDGSSSAKTPIFHALQEKPGCMVVTHAVNLGKGRALKTGINAILCAPFSASLLGVLTLDSDGQHSAQNALDCAQALCRRPDALILGTRDFSLPQVPFKSRAGNRITTFVFQLLYAKRINDTQTGLRAIPFSMLQAMLTLPGERFEYELAMLIYTVKHHFPIAEVPIETIYLEQNRHSHFRAFADSLKIYRLLFSSFLRYSFSSIVCFCLDIALFALLTSALSFMSSLRVRLFWATALARAVSSLCNFFFNRSLVFQNKTNLKESLVKYYALCILQALCSWGIVWLLSASIPVSATLIKVFVDLGLFVISYQVQARFVFAPKRISKN